MFDRVVIAAIFLLVVCGPVAAAAVIDELKKAFRG